jgi:tetraacyldisaccharide 4'-kinase
MIWQTKNTLAYLLLPLSFLYRTIIAIRKWLYQKKIKKTTTFPVPVIVVGNITVGGTGKTPLVIWLANFLRQHGYHPGIVSRGYGAKALQYPMTVMPESDPSLVGDEPLLIVRNTQCPMVVDPQRVRAVKKLLLDTRCDIVISDDGLQHYALGRAIEMVVVDGARKFGNEFCLPAGPLREPIARLNTVNFVITNGVEQKLIPTSFRRVNNSTIVQTVNDFKNKTIHAVAGIGYPPRFFNLLRELGLTIIEHSFPDHHKFQATDLIFSEDAIIVMTEKDAVKCEKFAQDTVWYLAVEAQLNAEVGEKILQLLTAILKKRIN